MNLNYVTATRVGEVSHNECNSGPAKFSDVVSDEVSPPASPREVELFAPNAIEELGVDVDIAANSKVELPPNASVSRRGSVTIPVMSQRELYAQAMIEELGLEDDPAPSNVDLPPNASVSRRGSVFIPVLSQRVLRADNDEAPTARALLAETDEGRLAVIL